MNFTCRSSRTPTAQHCKYERRGIRSGQQGSMSTSSWKGSSSTALNGGPMFSFTPAISMFIAVRIRTNRLLLDTTLRRREMSRCGWLKDKFGLSWQVSHDSRQMMGDKDPVKSKARDECYVADEKARNRHAATPRSVSVTHFLLGGTIDERPLELETGIPWRPKIVMIGYSMRPRPLVWDALLRPACRGARCHSFRERMTIP